MSNFNLLLEKLDGFIRKYYKNKLIRGGIYSASLLFSFFIFIILAEYFGQFDVFGRSLLFFSFIGVSLFVLIFYVIIPATKLAKMGKIISYEEAAKIVGNHFGNVQDKIVNTLQLYNNQKDISPEQTNLLIASINQRIGQLSPLPFSSAIDLSENKKHIKYLLIPLIIILAIVFVDSKIITGSTSNLINYNSKIIPSAPFSFLIDNEALNVLEKDDFVLSVSVSGEKIPNDVYVNVNGKKHKLQKISKLGFSYTFRNVQKNQLFSLEGGGFSSKEYTLTTIPKPSLMGFSIDLDYPEHTKKQDEIVKNTGDLFVPEGTKIRWSFGTKNTESLSVEFIDTNFTLSALKENSFVLQQSLFESSYYKISTKNNLTENHDTVSYYITVIKDAIPSIRVEEKTDSLNPFIKYFNGSISDDYGFSKLLFQYRKITEGKPAPFQTKSFPVSSSFNQDQFFHFLDLSSLNLIPGEKLEYFFTIWDNDRINGPKSSRSQTNIYKAPSLEELADKADKANQEIKDELSESLKEAEELTKQLKEIQKNLLEKQNPDWQDKNKLENFLEKQKELENKINQLQQENSTKNQEQNEFNKPNEEILKKQELLNELFEQLMTDEMKKLYEELQKMMEEMNKDQLLNQLDKIEMTQEQIEKELDRSIEQFKQMEFETKMESITSRLEELAKKQEKLSEETKNKEKSNFELNKEQEKLKEEFQKVQQDLDELNELNEDLENKNQLPDTEQKETEIQENMKKSQEELGEKKNKKASEMQKEAAEDIQKMTQEMRQMMESQQAENAGEDMDALRQLLENLIQFSFEQEDVMNQFTGLNPKDPKYVKLGQRQRKLEDDALLLEDSLFALSKRVMQLSPHINKEVAEMKNNLQKSIKHITERQTPMAISNQQYVMTATNNLALLFDEALQQMQEAMKKSMPGSGQCNKPGGSGKPSEGVMKNMKEQMQKQLERMKEAMEKGNKPGGKKDGDKGENGQKPGGQGAGGMGGMSSKEIAQMAAEQAALRREIEKMGQELNKDGSGNGNSLKEIAKDMEKVEEDLVNKRFSNQTYMRQKDIMTRLLEHEKAQREREYDNKRKSNEAKDQLFSNPSEYLKYKEKKEKEIELLKTIPPSLKPYYKNKVNEYFNQIDQ